MLFKISSIAALIAATSAHMAILEPCVRYSAHNTKCPALPPGESVDYSLNSPLEPNAPLCKHTTPYATPAATWTAGQDITVKFDTVGGAAHSGGHCEFSLSYDGGKTFVVIHQELKYCFFNGPASGNTPQVLSYTFKLPSNVPSSDKAIFAWTWVNASGNREFYMNCADVAIKGTSGSFTGKEMTIANHNGYPTIPEFGGNYETGLDLYKKAKQITVTGSGNSGSSNQQDTTPSQPAQSSAAAGSSAPSAASSAPAAASSAPAAASAASKPSTGNAPAPSSAAAAGAGSSGSCTYGTLRCAPSSTGFQYCLSNGSWGEVYACGGGTKCLGTGDIYCGYE